MDARQRVLLVTQEGGDEKTKHVVCAEPSPDAMVAVSKAFEAQASVAGKGNVGIGASSAEALGKLAVRSQTVQLLRDGLYRACEAYLNGAISNNDYNKIMRGYDVAMVTLLAVESLSGMRSDTSHNVTPGVIPLSAKQVGTDGVGGSGNLPMGGGATGSDVGQQGESGQDGWKPGEPAPGMDPVVDGELTSLDSDPTVAVAVENIMRMFYEYRRDVSEAERPFAQVDALLKLEKKRFEIAKELGMLGLTYDPEKNMYGMIRMFEPKFGASQPQYGDSPMEMPYFSPQ